MYKSPLRTLCLIGALIAAFAYTSVAQPATACARTTLNSLFDRLGKQIHHAVLPNGTSILFLKAANTNAVSVGALIDVGTSDEQQQEWGMAFLVSQLIHAQLDEKIARALDPAYKQGGLGRAYLDRSLILYDARKETWNVCADALVKTLNSFTPTPQMLANVSLEVLTSDVFEQPHLGMNSFFPLNHKYGHSLYGVKEQFASCTVSALQQFYRKQYTPEKTTLFVVGDIEWADVRAAYSSAFSGAQPQLKRKARTQSTEPFYSGLSTEQRLVYTLDTETIVQFAWMCPGQKHPDGWGIDFLCPFIKKRIEKRFMAAGFDEFSVTCNYESAEEASVFSIILREFGQDTLDALKRLVFEELELLGREGITEGEYCAFQQNLLLHVARYIDEPVELVLFSRTIREVGISVFSFEKERILRLKERSIEDLRRLLELYVRPYLVQQRLIVPLPESERAVQYEKLQKSAAYNQNLLNSNQWQSDSGVSPSSEDESQLGMKQEIAFVPVEPLGFEQFQLKNGITVWWRPERAAPFCVGGIVLKDFERLRRLQACRGKEAAFAAWAELACLDAATQSTEPFQALCEQKGVMISKGAGFFMVSSLKDSFDDALVLLKEGVAGTGYTHTALKKYIQKKSHEYTMQKSLVDRIVLDHVINTVCAHRPWLVSSGRMLDRLKNLTISDIEFVSECMQTPSCISVVLSGDLSSEEARRFAEKHFGHLLGDAPQVVDGVECAEHGPIVQDVLVLSGAPTEMHMFHDLPAPETPDWYAYQLALVEFRKMLNEFLGRMPLVEKIELTVDADVPGYMGFLQLSITVKPGNEQLVRAEITRLMDQYAAQLVDESFLRRVCAEYAQLEMTLYRHTAVSVARAALFRIIYSLPCQYDELVAKGLAKVTVDGLQAAFKKLGDRSTWSVVAVEPASE